MQLLDDQWAWIGKEGKNRESEISLAQEDKGNN
jgi:hypothetical protein